MKTLLILLFFSMLFLSCDGGLTLPPDVEPGITGRITVQGAWPPPDSVKTLWIFASQIFPLDSSKVVSGILENKILLYPSVVGTLPYNVNAQNFNFPLPPATYFYVGVLQRFGDNLFDPRSYRVVGVYLDPTSGNPKSITIHEFEIVSNVVMDVNFYSLPPQPF